MGPIDARRQWATQVNDCEGGEACSECLRCILHSASAFRVRFLWDFLNTVCTHLDPCSRGPSGHHRSHQSPSRSRGSAMPSSADVEDCRSLLVQEEVPEKWQFPKRAMAITMMTLMVGTVVAVIWLRPNGQQAKSATLMVIGESTKWINHKFGEVPLQLEISGISCGLNDQANGVYQYEGTTKDGRPFYKGPASGLTWLLPWQTKNFYLFYDKECDGSKGGKDSQWGSFFIKTMSYSPSTSASEDLDSDHKCSGAANTIYGSKGPSSRSKPWYHGKAGALPGEHVKWNVWCGHYHGRPGWTVESIEVKGGLTSVKKPLKASGEWKYVRTVSAGMSQTETYGVEKTESNGGGWDLGAEISAKAEGKADVPFVAEGEVETSATAKAAMQGSWEAATSSHHQLETKVPFDASGALWQWTFTVTQGDHEGIVKASDLAVTDSRAQPPRCYPGYSADDPIIHYQKCVSGGELK